MLFYLYNNTDSFFLHKDLVNEKLKTQQMNNDLEKLAHELEKIGLNKERLLHDEQSSDDRWEHRGLPGAVESGGSLLALEMRWFYSLVCTCSCTLTDPRRAWLFSEMNKVVDVLLHSAVCESQLPLFVAKKFLEVCQ